MFKGREHSKYMKVQPYLVLGMEADLIHYFQNLEDEDTFISGFDHNVCTHSRFVSQHRI